MRPTHIGLYQARLVPKSGNKKTGPIPTSYTSARTCPTACPLLGNGCYAEQYPVREHWGDAARFVDWLTFVASVRALPAGQLWRHNVAGDLPGEGNALDTVALGLLVEANRGKRGFTYTHKPLTRVVVSAIRRAVKAGFTINASADSLAEADAAAALGLPTVVTLPTDAPQVSKTPEGRTVVACPAEKREITCERCQLCSVATRKTIVGFRAHGQSKNRINRRLQVVQ